MQREIHIRDYIAILRKRRYSIVAFFSIVFVLVLLGTFTSTPIYLANTNVLIERSEPSSALLNNYAYQPYDPDFYQTQYQLIKSSSVTRRVVKKLSLDTKYDSYFKKGGSMKGGGLMGLFGNEDDIGDSSIGDTGGEGQKVPEDTARVDSLARMISSGIIVTPVRSSRIVNISYRSTSPELAALIANTVAEAYIEELLDMRMSSSRYAIEWMTKKVQEERDRLEASENSLQEYMRAQDIVTLENKVTIVPQKLSEIGSELLKAEAQRKEMESLKSKVQNISSKLEDLETLSAISSDPTLQSLRQQILNSEQNVLELSKKYGEKHPVMIAARDELQALNNKRTHEIRRVVDSINNEYELAVSKESDLKRLLTETKNEALNLNEKFIQYEVLKRDVETNRQLYEALMKRIKEQSITEEIQPVRVWIIEKARVPSSPVKPRKAMNILFGLVAGLLGGIGLAFFIEYLDNTVKSPDETEAKVGKPVIGMISLVTNKEEENIEGIVFREPKSIIAESYKHLRTSILLSSATAPPKNILVTSVGPEEGKTVTSVNLAMAISQSGHSVLLIDGDLRKPRIHKVFGFDNSEGLSTCLAGVSTLDVIKTDPAHRLSVLCSGPIPPNPSELLSAESMQKLMRELNEKFDFIIWDSPPLLTVADSLVLSKLVDATLIVTWAGRTTYDGIRRGIKSMSDIGANILGILINAVDIKKDNYYYKYYSYYYSYGETKED